MKKGEDKKKQIIETAERLFYEKGYEQTSIQDILDATGLSKGGFYHYFDAKSALLDEICRLQSERDREATARAVAARDSAVDQLNAFFGCCGLWRRDRADYAGLMLRAAYRGDGASLRERLRSQLMENALPLLNGIIARGIDQKVSFTRFPDEIGELIIRLFANISDELALTAVSSPADAPNLNAMLGRLEVYRASVETLLNAPFGSVRLCDLSCVSAVLGEMNAQEKRFAAKA